MKPGDHEGRMRRAILALDGLSIGDAFGGRFFNPPGESRALPPPPWPWSDDTEMGAAIVDVLDRHGRIDPDDLAREFARRHRDDPHRGYGLSVRRTLEEIAGGVPWAEAAGRVFGGAGSMGNGGAMRAAPVGAYFRGDYAEAAGQADISAAVTHAHPEGRAGAIAVAVSSAWAARIGGSGRGRPGAEMLEAAIEYTPEGETRSGIARALAIGPDREAAEAAAILGNGGRITAPDTVPFALWCAARHIGDYAEALWTVASAGGDNDTNGAIAGGIVALASGPRSIPGEWLAARESLPRSRARGAPACP